jgi:hypothetical protein
MQLIEAHPWLKLDTIHLHGRLLKVDMPWSVSVLCDRIRRKLLLRKIGPNQVLLIHWRMMFDILLQAMRDTREKAFQWTNWSVRIEKNHLH